MEEDFRALLLADTAVTGFVGDRINFGEHPQGAAYPAAVLQTISNVTDMHMNGAGGLEQGRVQVDCYGETYAAAKTLARAVTTALHFHRDENFFFINQISSRDSREGGSNEVRRLYRVSLDFNTAWRPTT